MEQLFETARKASGKKGPGNKTPGGRLSWTLRFVRVLFNLALVFVVGVLVVASGLYAYVLYVLNESGDPSGAVASVEAQNGALRPWPARKTTSAWPSTLAVSRGAPSSRLCSRPRSGSMARQRPPTTCHRT